MIDYDSVIHYTRTESVLYREVFIIIKGQYCITIIKTCVLRAPERKRVGANTSARL